VNYKFLIGARRAGVMLLALALMGLGAAWAITVEADFGLLVPTADASLTSAATTHDVYTGTGVDVGKKVTVTLSTAPIAGSAYRYTGDAVISQTGLSNGDVVRIVDKSKSTTFKFKTITFATGFSGIDIRWDGATVTGLTAKNATFVPALANEDPTKEGAFLIAGTGNVVKLYSGSITSSAQTLITTDGTDFIIGTEVEANAVGKSLTLTSNGSGATIKSTGNYVQVNTPKDGSYKIIGNNGPAILATNGNVVIGTWGSALGQTSYRSSGNGIEISGWATTTSLVRGSAAIQANGDITILNGSTTAISEKVVVRSRGQFVLYNEDATFGYGIDVWNARLEHGTTLENASVISNATSSGGVNLYDVKVHGFSGTGAASVTTQLPGKVVNGSGYVRINQGAYAPANLIAVSTSGDIDLLGVKLSAKGTPTGQLAVITGGDGNVTLAATATNDAEVLFDGGTHATYRVHGITTNAGTVSVESDYTGKVAGVKVNNGIGNGIVAKVVSVRGKNKDNLAYITVKDGRAIESYDSDAGADNAVTLKDVNISRTGTGITGREEAVYVYGGHVTFDGVNSAVTAVTGTGSIAIFASENILTTTPADPVGNVRIDGGKISGNKSAVVARNVTISDGTNAVLTKTNLVTVISAVSDIAISANKDVVVNNPAAVVLLTAGTSGVKGGAIKSGAGTITVYNADSIYAAGAGVPALSALESRNAAGNLIDGTGFVYVYGGKVRSAGGTAIVGDQAILVDQNRVVAQSGGTPVKNTTPILTEGFIGVTAVRGLRSIYVTSNGTADYAGIESKNANVFVGDATVTSTVAGTPAIKVVNGLSIKTNPVQQFGSVQSPAEGLGVVVVNNARATIVSRLGDGIKVENGDVLVSEGSVESGAATGSAVFAAINVKNGNVRVGQAYNAGWGPTKTKETANDDRMSYIIASGAGSIGIYVNSQFAASQVVVDKLNAAGDASTVISVRNTSASAGAIRVEGDVTVNFNADILADMVGQTSYGIRASLGTASNSGDVNIGQFARIKMKGGPAVVDTNVNINIGDNALIEGESVRGGLIRLAKRASTVKKFAVHVSGNAQVYSWIGKTINSDDSVVVSGSKWQDIPGQPTGALVKNDLDTAISAGSATLAGVVVIKGGKVQAGGVNAANAKPIAVVAKHVQLIENGTVEANTPRLAAEDEERYPNSKATGIMIPGPARLSGGATLLIGNDTLDNGNKNRGSTAQALVIANGASIGVDIRDSIGHYRIYGANENAVRILAGHNGIGIQSVGQLKIEGSDDFKEASTFRDETGLHVSIRVKAGTGAASKAISIPVNAGRLKPSLRVDSAFVEAGSDGAIAISSGTNVVDSVVRSVVLVRHGSKGVKGDGGVYVNASYVEVLGTEENRTGTAIESLNGINISGGNAEDAEERSEIHSKGIAVFDGGGEKNIIQVTGYVFMSGTVGSNMHIGSSTVGDSAKVTMGANSRSRDLWKLSVASDVTEWREAGKTLIIPDGVVVQVRDNGSRLWSQEGDTVKIAGMLTTKGTQAGAKFINSGKVIVEKGGNVVFNSVDVESFKNDGPKAKVVLKTGAKLNDSLLVHDTIGHSFQSAYTFLKWADTLSGAANVPAARSRGTGKVVVPPLYAVLYGEQNKVIFDGVEIPNQTFDGSRGKWNEFSTRTDTVYSVVDVDYPLDRRYAEYLQDEDSLAKGNFRLHDDKGEMITISDDSIRVFTKAGTFTRVAKMRNEAGEGTKTYTHIVLPVSLQKITKYQAAGSSEAFYFDGIINNIDGKRVPEKDTTDVSIREGDVAVLYSGDPNKKLVDRVAGGLLPDDFRNVSDPETPIYYKGLGVPTFWYEGADDDTRYQLSSNTPVNKGLYNVYASFSAGENFVAVPSEPSKVVYIGQVEIVEGTLESVFGFKDSKYDIEVKLEAKKAYNNVNVALLNLLPYGAKYNEENLEPTGNAADALVAGSARFSPTSSDSTLVFSVTNATEYNQTMVFTLQIDPAYGENFDNSQLITVTVKFVTAAEMKEMKPEITVNYRESKLTGLKARARYTINGTAFTPTLDTVAIATEWEGTTLKIVKLPASNYTQPSDTAYVVIAARATVASDAVKAVKGDSASTSIAPDGRLSGTTAAMEYKLASAETWTQASNEVTRSLVAGVYQVRDRATDSTFAGPAVTVTIYARSIAVTETAREIPNKQVTTEAAVAPVAKSVAGLTVGPSPVASNAQAKIFWNGSKSVKGTLSVFNSNGKKVASVKVSGTKQVGVWNVNNAATGTYLLKGTLSSDGAKVKVTIPVAVVR